MLKHPKISVITVVKNSESTIEHTLKSVANQTYANKEHWILDGASTDNTLNIVKRYAQQYSHIQWFSAKDKGMYDALNKGMQLANGEILGFLHADDFYAKNSVLDEVALSFNPFTQAVYSDLLYVDPHDLKKIKRYWQSKPYEKGAFARGWCPPHPTFFVKKTTYERLGGFDTSLNLGNDVELMMRFMEKHNVPTKYCPGVWVVMRAGGISNKSIKNILQQNLSIMQSFKKHDLPFSWMYFILGKCIDRLKQIVHKHHVDYSLENA
ncbi:MAG TPA: glycosyltransferase family 2 protein [Gammaproteobacteria bacterium]|nr:glycosyltransferase family 2 protein [Gammaproteobacteria bacterium]